MEKVGPSCDSDTSEELPDLYTKRTFDVAKLAKNEIVWAAFKELYWPALVRDVDKKKRKVRVWYLDSPGKCFKVPFNKIHDFCDAEFNKVVHKDAKLNSLGPKHHEVFRRTLLFVFRRSRGIQDNPAEFFDTSKPYFLLKDFNPESSEFKSTNENSSTERVGDNDDNLKESSEGESLVESDEESGPSTKVFPELYVEDSPYNDEMVDKIISFIKGGHVDKHLMDVWNSKIASERHDLYVEAMKTCNTELLSNSPPYIPINNHEKLHNVSIYLFDLYERKIGKGKPKMTEYVVSVWLPEAVDKAISLIEADSWQKTIDSGNDNVTTSPLEDEAFKKTIDLNIENLSYSPFVVESSELAIDCGHKVSSLSTEVEAEVQSLELPIDYDKVSTLPTVVKASKANKSPEAQSVEEVARELAANFEKIISTRSTSKYEADSTSTDVFSAPSFGNIKNVTLSCSRKRKRRSKTMTSPEKNVVFTLTKPEEENLPRRKTYALFESASESEESP